ncbi:AMP-dependent synthetase/ligase [Niveomyces insectorum RCEF 264]|uniref:AMP-dependent synthetase/ligase n=1 Tax=Niveomyces insectorum RCEF 264 TaxID=1081102 RepID=A0A167TAU6_9HYPO|nr:AMP-dependent synthetase/ligase [Niveomyces insectorum RCEF 264]
MAADHRATGLYGVATMFVAMLELLEEGMGSGGGGGAVLPPDQAAALPTHLRTGIAAGSSVPEALMRRLFATLGLPDLVICYGMTETAPVSCMTAPRDPLAKRTTTVGRVLPHTAVKIVDPHDRTRIVPRGTPGELAAGGYLVMQGYWGDAAQTAAVLRTDDTADHTTWMHSGDEAVMDADGYVAVTGRLTDLIIRGGENIHPLEVENCLFQHPRVAEVSVVGVPDARYGEAVAAFVVPHGGVRVQGGLPLGDGPAARPTTPSDGDADAPTLSADDVRGWVRSRLSPHLVPAHVFWTDAYPKTASGKIQKFKLRAAAVAALAAREKGTLL